MPRTYDSLNVFRCWMCKSECDMADVKPFKIEENKMVLICSTCRGKKTEVEKEVSESLNVSQGIIRCASVESSSQLLVKNNIIQ